MTIDRPRLSAVSETMLFTLYCRAADARSRDPILGDPYAAEVLRAVRHHLPLKIRLAATDPGVITLRAKRLDDWTREFIAGNPDGMVLHLACGLDSRAFRLDVPATVDWIDLDFAEVIALREQLYPARPGYRTIGASATEADWLPDLATNRPLLIIAEGLVMYLPVSKVKELLHRLTGHFRSGGLLLDVVAPWVARGAALTGYTLHWGVTDPHQLERWNQRLSLADDAPIFADHARARHPASRAALHTLSRIPSLRNGFRALRFRF